MGGGSSRHRPAPQASEAAQPARKTPPRKKRSKDLAARGGGSPTESTPRTEPSSGPRPDSCASGPEADPAEEQENFVSINESLMGIKMSAVKKCIAVMGEENLRGLQTYEVVSTFVRNETAKRKTSWTTLLFNSKCKQDRDGVGQAQMFISHAWGMEFLNMINTVDRFLQRKVDEVGEEPCIWLDVFCVSQHIIPGQSTKDTSWFLKTFMDAVGQMGSVMMILTPWYDPLPLNRAWCIWELFSCQATAGAFHATFPPDQLDPFVEAIAANPQETMQRMFARLQTEKSSCGMPGEKDPVKRRQNEENHNAIVHGMEARHVTFQELDKLVLTTIRNAVLDGLIHLAREEAMAPLRRGVLLAAVGSVNLSNGNYEAAVAACEEADAVLQEAGTGHGKADRVAALGTMAVALCRLKRWGEALAAVEVVLGASTKLWGPAGIKTLNARLNKALEECEQTLAASREALGPEHEVTLRARYYLGREQYQLRRFAESAAELAECLKKRKEVLGAYHNETAAAGFWLGKAYFRMGEFDVAKTYMKRAAEVFERNEDPMYYHMCKGWLQESSYLSSLQDGIPESDVGA